MLVKFESMRLIVHSKHKALHISSIFSKATAASWPSLQLCFLAPVWNRSGVLRLAVLNERR